MRACRETGLSRWPYIRRRTEALFAKYADEAFLIGPAPASQSYLNIEKIIDMAKECGADAIHPGYGFLAENPRFAAACEEEGLKFIGPSTRVLELMGDKVAARRRDGEGGCSGRARRDECITGPQQAKGIADEIGYPVIIKPSGGGGGIGMTIAADEGELPEGARIHPGDRREHLRHRRRLHREVSARSPSHRVSDPRRLAGERHPPGRTGMFHTAKASEADRGIPVPCADAELRQSMGEVAVNAARCGGLRREQER